MDYQAAIDYIDSFTDYEKSPGILYTAANYDLARMKSLLRRVGDPHLWARTVHLAGTKGKGSTAAMIATSLTASGSRTGLFTSPHLHTIRERIQVDGDQVAPEEMAAVLTGLRPHVEEMQWLKEHGKLTTFEILTATAFLYFMQRECDFQVVEAGLGGRLDATNVVKPEVVILTSISLDHTAILGDTVEKIATEKSGVIKPGSVVISAPQVEEAAQVIEQVCRQKRARLIAVGKDVQWRKLESSLEGQLFDIWTNRDEYRLNIPLLGEHQLENAAVAVAALEELMQNGSITRQSIARGIETVHWPGRLQVLARNPTFVVDGAHNRYSARKLKEATGEYFDFERLVLIVGTSSDKDVAGIVEELAPLADEVVVTRSRHPRSAQVEVLQSEFLKAGKEAEVADGVPAAIDKAMSLAGPKDLILATGSLFVVAEAIEYMTSAGEEAAAFGILLEMKRSRG